MPTIESSYKDLKRLVGKRIEIAQLKKDLSYAASGLEGKRGDKLKIEIQDKNRPDLWCIEGISRELRMKYGKSIKKFRFGKPKITIKVDRSVMKIRPHIAGFLVKRVRVTKDLLDQLIQVQEKLSENYGRKRKKISIGLYDFSRVKLPLIYKAVNPTSRFAPLGYEKEMSLSTILKVHEKGKEYGHLLKDFEKYPLFVDKKGTVLSFPPIINSNHAGSLEPGKKNIFVEVTGTDQNAVLLMINVLSQVFHMRGYAVHRARVKYPKKTKYGKTVATPFDFKDRIKINLDEMNTWLGTSLKWPEVKTLLKQRGFNFKKKWILIPFYRRDILHPVDIYEDVAIALDYNNMEIKLPEDFTVGELLPITYFSRKTAEIMVGTGFQEIANHILTEKEKLFKKMNLKNEKIMELENYMSKTYSCLRSWIIPSLVEFDSKNKHVEYPHKIFEIGEVCIPDAKEETKSKTIVKLGALISGDKTNFSELYSVLHKLLDQLGLRFTIKSIDHKSFEKGRCGEIRVKGKKVGIIGELNKKVKEKWGLTVSTIVFELDLSFFQ